MLMDCLIKRLLSNKIGLKLHRTSVFRLTGMFRFGLLRFKFMDKLGLLCFGWMKPICSRLLFELSIA